VPQASFALPEVKTTFPRLANYFLHWTISEEEARELKKWDLLILDMEVQERSRRELQLLRELNPNIILLAYITSVEIRKDALTLPEGVAPLRRKLATSYLKPEWFITDVGGSRRSFWPGTWIVNITDRAPLIEGRRWQDVLPQFVSNEILDTGLWDGIFYDNGWEDPSHHTGAGLDLDRDGQAESRESVNAVWQEGMQKLLENTSRLFGDRALIMMNGNLAYASQVNGLMFEYFPRQGWAQTMAKYKTSISQNHPPALPVVNTIGRTGKPDDYSQFRYGLTSTFLDDGFYSFDSGLTDHGQTWWYDEYEAFLGEPLGEAKKRDVSNFARQNLETSPFSAGLWRRDFEKGIAFVNSSTTTQTVELPIEIEKLRGRQDSVVNDGLITRRLQIEAQDGLIVLRPLQTIVGAPFENGVFARVFNAAGEVARAGFFALDRREESGVVMASMDLDGDERVEKVKREEGGIVKIIFGSGQQTSFAPFGAGARSEEISLALGDVTGEGVKEIVVSYRGQVRIYRIDGTLLVTPFFPFGSRYRGAVNVAVGDLNRDGFSEIVVGAGAGGGPFVRIFSGEGRLLSGGFFAYDPRFRGGVRVAVGDVDDDGQAEIVTGPGIGGGPQIRIFNNKGQAAGPGFFAFDQSARGGVIPIVADADGDGRNEILAVTREAE